MRESARPNKREEEEKEKKKVKKEKYRTVEGIERGKEWRDEGIRVSTMLDVFTRRRFAIQNGGDRLVSWHDSQR